MDSFKKSLVGCLMSSLLLAVCVLSVAGEPDSVFVPAAESKVKCTATLEDDFADDSLIVIINEQASKDMKSYDTNDFSEIRAEDIQELTQDIKTTIEEQQAFLQTVFVKQQQSRYSQTVFPGSGTDASLAEEVRQLKTLQDSYQQIIEIRLEEKGKQNVLNAISELEKRDDVFAAQPNYRYYACAEPNDIYLDSQYHIDKISLKDAWDVTTGDSDVVVGVVDSGILTNHEDLYRRVDASLSKDFTGANNISTDPCGHGTHVAGIIGACGNNLKGIAGVCWNIRLANLRVLDSEGEGYTNDFVNAVSFATAKNIPILNFSLSGEQEDTAFKTVISKYPGLIVAAADNDGNLNNDQYPQYPASYTNSNILSVAATNHKDQLWDFSHYGKTSVDLAAPGEDIYSTVPEESVKYPYNPKGYQFSSGTSMAAPYVAGTAALIKSQFPNLTTSEIRNSILNGVDKLSSLSGKCVTGGRLNVAKALEKAAVYARSNYPADQLITGDFDGDGLDDALTIKSLMGQNGTSNKIQFCVARGGGNTTRIWKTVSQYNGSKIINRVVAGDFNGDGKDDVAMMYDYENNKPQTHVFLSTGTSFQDWRSWYTETGFFNPDLVTGRYTAGDFNGDGKDDIAAMYDYADNTTKILVFISKGSSFNAWKSWYYEDTPYYYNASGVTDRFEAGDFNGDGKDDIATFYQYGDNTAQIHIFISTGAKFNNWQTWYAEDNPGYYNLDRVKDRFAVGDYNGDGKDDVATMYNKGNGTVQIHMFLSTGTSLTNWSIWYTSNANSFYADNTCMAAGDFTGDGKDDLVSFYDYQNGLSSLLRFKSLGVAMGGKFENWTKWIVSIQGIIGSKFI